MGTGKNSHICYVVDLGLSKKYTRESKIFNYFRQTHTLQRGKVADRNSKICQCKYSHGYLAVKKGWHWIDRLRDDVSFERNIAMAEHEGKRHKNKVQNDFG